MMATYTHAIDLYVAACGKSDIDGQDAALSLLGSVRVTDAELRTVVAAHKRLQSTGAERIRVLDASIVRSTDDDEFDALAHRRDMLVFEYYMWDKLVRYVEDLLHMRSAQ